jgi:FdhE protein
VLAAWAAWPGPPPPPLGWDAEACRARWRRGVPLLAETAVPLAAPALEDLLAAGMEAVATLDAEDGLALQRLAEAWDRREVVPADFLPTQGGVGAPAVREATGLRAEVVGFLAVAMLRPALEAVVAPCRAHLAASEWTRGSCPFCGAPPVFGDIVESGARQLACAVCGSGWPFARLRCPFCGTEASGDLRRLLAEGAEEGYAVQGCRACGGYLKEIDRRARWNGVDARLEDWGSPHLDLVAVRAGYARPLPSLVQLARQPPS